MGNIFGIDIGRYSIKMAGVKTTIRGSELNLSKEFIFPEGTGVFSDSNTNNLRDFFTVEGLESADVIVSIPSDLIAVHTISVPFTNDKFIAKAIGPELEEVSTLSLEETTMDYNIIRKEDGRSSVITFSMNSDTMKLWLDAFLLFGLDPNIIDVSHCAYSNLATYLKLDTPFVVIDIGHAHTSLSFMDSNGLFLARDLRITAPMLGLTTGKNELNREVANTFINQIKFAVDAAEKRYNTKIQAAVFAGRFSEAGSSFEKQLELQTFSVPVHDIVKVAINENTSLEPQYTLALTLTLRSIMKRARNTVNLRTGLFRFQRAIEQIKGRLLTTLIIAGLLVIMAIVNISYGYVSLRHKKDTLEQRMHTVFKNAFPNEPSLGDPLGTMHYLVSKEKKKAENLSSSLPVIEVLRELSTAIPKDITVDVTELSIDPEQITLIGKTPTIDAIDKIVAGFKNLSSVKDVKVLDTNRSADQKSFKFQLNITLK